MVILNKVHRDLPPNKTNYKNDFFECSNNRLWKLVSNQLIFQKLSNQDFFSFRGSAIARIVGGNVKSNPGFNHEVRMWVFEEIIDGRKLTEIINEDHENVKYLQGFTIPDNVVIY